MRKVVLVCLLLAACTKGNDYPVGGGGGGGTGGGGGGVDAPSGGDGGDGTTLEGHVCLVTNLATPFTACDDTNATGFMVKLGAYTATTTLGAFTITRPLSTSVIWQVSGTNLVPSTMPFGPIAVIPVMKKADYDALATTNNVMAGAGLGIVVAAIVHRDATTGTVNGLPNVSSAPTTPDGPLYDPASGATWNIKTKTGADGTVWYPDAPAGAAQSLTFTAGSAVTVAGIPVVDNADGDAMTFIRVEM
jgi:hypothetical protein